MNIDYYIDKIKFQLTGDVLESEISDETYKRLINFSLEEMNRYYDVTSLVQADIEVNSGCLDITKLEEKNNISISSISNLYRTKPNGCNSNNDKETVDPMALAQWNFGNGYYGVTNRWVYNYYAYNLINQMNNTISTDLDYKMDQTGRKLYINFSGYQPTEVTIEYVPKLKSVEEINSQYWIDILSRLSLANAKIALGRIRTRYTQENALWKQDGEKLLEEGTTELKELREKLTAQANFSYPLD